jgi:hypothetical protein
MQYTFKSGRFNETSLYSPEVTRWAADMLAEAISDWLKTI